MGMAFILVHTHFGKTVYFPYMFPAAEQTTTKSE